MKRQIKWVDKSGEVKREIRVTFVPGDRIKWQFKPADRASWDYDTPPTEEDWDELQTKVENRIQRGTVQAKDLDLVKKCRQGR
jgi:hypothetical protein